MALARFSKIQTKAQHCKRKNVGEIKEIMVKQSVSTQ